MKKRKHSANPPDARETRFISMLDGWQSVLIEEPFGFTPIECIISPDNKTYRRANGWEKPMLVIHADILPPEHHIRLVRVTNLMLRKLAKKALRNRARLRKGKV